MNFKPLVSIVIPVYNGSDFLRESIQSALDQDYENKEVIVVNDGSTDRGATEEIAKSFGNQIRYYFKPNGGVASALNFAIKLMRGEYFSWLSHDDLYKRNKISSQIEYINFFKVKDAILYSNYDLIDTSGKIFKKVELPEVAPEKMYSHLLTNQSLHGCTLLIPRQAFEINLFPERYPTTQDYELWLTLSRHYRFLRSDKVLVSSRQHPNQGSRLIASHKEDVENFYTRHLPKVLQHCREITNPQIIKKAQLTILCDLLVNVLLSKSLNTFSKLLFLGSREIGVTIPDFLFIRILSRAVLKKVFHFLPVSLRPLALKGQAIIDSGSLSDKVNLNFGGIFLKNGFNGSESLSGAGSTMFLTREVRAQLPQILKQLEASSLLDIPCGDFHWMSKVNLGSINYSGADIVEELIVQNNKVFSNEKISFAKLDLISEKLPQVDVIFCRDCLVHLPNESIMKALKNIVNSGSKWLITTTFTDRELNRELSGITWRPVNLQKAPFNLPEPSIVLNELCTEQGGKFGDKSLAVWSIAEMSKYLNK